ncbi:MAG: arginine deiminase family protein [Cytophagales bacterium]|nr:arginine deiminase family protein [Cytophagales bacterium]
MIQNKVYSSQDIDFNIQKLQDLPMPGKLLMCEPTYFDILDVKNVHMEGNKGNLDKSKAMYQWKILKATFQNTIKQDILTEVAVIQGAEGCEDMVFAANQSFPWLDANANKMVIMSKMRHPSRQREVPFFKAFYEEMGYKTIELQHTPMFEGMGDLIYHTGKRLLYGGYGHRTVIEAYDELSAILQCPIIALELVDPNFYHLDTCFVSLGTDAVMICKEAFNQSGIDALHKMYERVYYIPKEEAIQHFALNAHTLFGQNNDNKVCVIQKGAQYTGNVLRREGFQVVEVDTSEFMKSGGSVFCMKMMFY